MTKKSKTGLIITLIIILLAIVGLVVFFVLKGLHKDEEYKPIEEFEEAYNAIKPDGASKKETYDLEKTIRVLNGLEVAQSEVEDFDEFLEYMAKQDYSGVAPEVLEAKAKLMPVLQEIYLLEKEYEGLNMWSTLVKNISANVTPKGVIDGVMDMAPMMEDQSIVEGAAAIGMGVGGLFVVSKTANFMFEQYKEEQDLKRDVKRRLKDIKSDYLEYLEEFTPVYVKYMTEWDRLCVDKDKAYIDLYRNQPEEVVKDCDKILANYPNNREALLLKSVGLIQSSSKTSNDNIVTFVSVEDSAQISVRNQLLDQAQATIDGYIDLYPSATAPALLLEGLIQEYRGNHNQAFSFYDQAAIEYPRQSEILTDMLDSYRLRTYLNNSREGTYLLNLYKSTMAGFGLFSPNLLKAIYYDQNGDYENCSTEIYNHFFRRSNQSTYDCLLSDMNFCENYMPNSFNRLMPEKSYVNITFEKKSKLLGLTSDDMMLEAQIDNQSDRDIVNLRVFLCIHFTDMYDGDYYVVKLPTINRITVRNSVEVEDVELKYRGKTFDDIAKVRAIAMTDNKIFWVDNVYNSSDNVDYNEAHEINYQQLSEALDSAAIRNRDSYLASIKKSDDVFRQSIMENSRIKVRTEKSLISKTKNYVDIELPRELILLNPTFTMNQKLKPEENYLKGSYIHLSFEIPPSVSAPQLYLTSEYLNYVITIRQKDGALKVVEVMNMAKNLR